MKEQLKDFIVPLLISVLVLIVAEVFVTTLLPLLGLSSFRIPFNILIILFLAFKIDSPYLAVFILVIQVCHSYFSIEGWEMGTIAGIFVCIFISFLRDVIHFSTYIVTALVTQLFQVVWFLIVSGLIYLKGGEIAYITAKFWRFIPESIFVSIIAHFFFILFDKIWNVKEKGMLGDGI